MRLLLCCLLLLASPAYGALDAPTPKRWIAYYGNDANATNLAPYDLIVLEYDHAPPVRQITGPKKTVLAYISAGEAGPHHIYFQQMKDSGVLMEAPTHWPGNQIIDARKPEWTAYLVEELIPAVLEAGFDGIMLDTLDTAAQAEASDATRYTGMRDATVRMVRTIRAHFPEIRIMVNRGFDILPQIAPYIDYALAESILVDYRKETDSQTYFPDEVHDSVSTMLLKLRETNPKLAILTLDYWPADDRDGVRAIYERQRAKGFVPYVGMFDLSTIVEEPK